MRRGVGGLQRGQRAVVERAAAKLINRGAKIHHGAACLEAVTVASVENGAPAGRQDNLRESCELLDHRRLAGAETGLAFEFENNGDLDARAALNHLVRVVEG